MENAPLNRVVQQGLLGRRISDDHFLLMFNASGEDIDFTVPAATFGDHWQLQLETADGTVGPVSGETWDADPGTP